ncbi:MAG TPA: prolyl oligopeptidase family serine peptidase [Vicinamibacterales bacterium]|jgi:dipeptidyl aminopeptidase/acylaminoacyl peptidase|nr:prolyl oligopeptidase family serine peptidase [Vicinamibacterales bacterium]
MRQLIWLAALPLLSALALHQPTTAQEAYLVPPSQIVATFDAPPLPQVIVSPSRQQLAVAARKGSPPLAELARPTLRLAGLRVDPKTNGPHRSAANGGSYAITLRTIADGRETPVVVPPQANVSNIRFSPDGAHLSFTNTRDAGIELWVADTKTGQAKLVSGADRLNAATGDPCDWLHDNVTLLCRLVPADRGAAPVEPVVPAGPTILENHDKAAPAPTYEDMIRTGHDETVFEYYVSSQLAAIDSTTGRKTPIGRAAIFDEVTASPDDHYILVSKVKRPFSHLIPINGFPQDVEIWSRGGDLARRVADVPSREGVPLTGVHTGPRDYHWRADQPATVVWVEALDGGSLKNKVPFRDKVVTLAAPFSGAPVELAKTEYRFTSLAFTERGIGLLSESDRATRRVRTWILEPGAGPRKLWERREEDRYADPGRPVIRHDNGALATGGGRGGAAGPIMQTGDQIYLTGDGASPEGDRPFLDRLNLKTLATERLFRSDTTSYESVVVPLSDDGKTVLTRSESLTDTPNYYARTLGPGGGRRAVTTFKDPQELFRGVERQFITYERKDGVKLSATLYLPPGYKKGERLPVIMWAYPREFSDTDTASQVVGSPNRFTVVAPGNSHMYLLLAGYAILDGPTMPIVGPGETANDHYVEQLVASAEAAIDKVVEMGVADRNRIGVGGHSYGAFMTANLLAHSRLFRAGFAESGAYNRTLTPFGFQSERRTFWEVPDLYGKMSPFYYAHQIKDPILLTHGEMDDNSGTFPIQSERFYMALKGHGATVRYMTLPYEAHGYAARETHLHLIAEKIAWFDKYVKNAAPKTATDQR